jgi:hypothetical protein
MLYMIGTAARVAPKADAGATGKAVRMLLLAVGIVLDQLG